MKMKKLLFAFVAVLLSTSSFANPLPNPSQDGPKCPIDAPCYYTGRAVGYTNENPPQAHTSNTDLYIKVVKINGDFFAIITHSTGGRLNGESNYVYKDSRDGYTHYFILGNNRYYFKM